MTTIALDDAAWASPWRHRRISEKLLWCLSLVVTALAVPSIIGTALVGIVAIVLILGSARIPVKMLVGAMFVPLGFILIGACSVVFSVGIGARNPYWQWGLLSIGPESLDMAWRLLLHALCGTLAVMVLALTTPMSDLLVWMVAHKVPAPLVEVASLTYRLLFVLLGTATAIVDAQRRRCGKLTIANAGSAVGTLLVHSWDRANRLDAGLAARGAEESLGITVAPKKRSAWMVFGCLVVVAAIWALGWWLAWR